MTYICKSTNEHMEYDIHSIVLGVYKNNGLWHSMISTYLRSNYVL